MTTVTVPDDNHSFKQIARDVFDIEEEEMNPYIISKILDRFHRGHLNVKTQSLSIDIENKYNVIFYNKSTTVMELYDRITQNETLIRIKSVKLVYLLILLLFELEIIDIHFMDSKALISLFDQKLKEEVLYMTLHNLKNLPLK